MTAASVGSLSAGDDLFHRLTSSLDERGRSLTWGLHGVNQSLQELRHTFTRHSRLWRYDNAHMVDGSATYRYWLFTSYAADRPMVQPEILRHRLRPSPARRRAANRLTSAAATFSIRSPTMKQPGRTSFRLIRYYNSMATPDTYAVSMGHELAHQLRPLSAHHQSFRHIRRRGRAPGRRSRSISRRVPAPTRRTATLI